MLTTGDDAGLGQAGRLEMVDSGTRGRIINVTSVHEHVPLGSSAAYVAAKHGLGGLTKSMALELAPHGITVNSVAPGEIATPMTGQTDEDPHGTARPAIPAGRPGDAREVAALICHLASPESSYTTGASYVIDGGMLLIPPRPTSSSRPESPRQRDSCVARRPPGTDLSDHSAIWARFGL